MRDSEALLKAVKELTEAIRNLNITTKEGLESIAQEVAELKTAIEMKG